MFLCHEMQEWRSLRPGLQSVFIQSIHPSHCLMTIRRFSYRCFRSFLLAAAAVAGGFGSMSAVEMSDTLTVSVRDSIAPSRRNIVQRVIDYFASSNKTPLTRRPSFTFIGGPHYSTSTGFGIGLVAAGNYSTNPGDTAVFPSNFSVFADLTTGGYYKVGVDGIHNYRNGDSRINYELSFNSYDTYFWGVGYAAGRDSNNKGKYQLIDVMLEADHLWRLKGRLFGGPIVRLNYLAARHRERPEQWEGLPVSYPAAAVGLRLEWDTRDNFTAPTRGWLLHLTQRFSPRFLGNGGRSYSSTEISLNHYRSLWRGAVLAGRLHAHLSYGHTPWGLMPTVGNSSTLRGYYQGRYRDKCETDFTLELRQHIWRRSGIVAWGGAGFVFPNVKGLRLRHILPNWGAGYRWEFKKQSNVRVDVGFGKCCWGFVLSMNEAF